MNQLRNQRNLPMKRITETIENVEVITEGKGDDKKLYIEGVYLQSEIKNRNGRMYRFQVLEKEVNRYNEEYVKTSRALGELGHPDGPTVNLTEYPTELPRFGQRVITSSEKHKF